MANSNVFYQTNDLAIKAIAFYGGQALWQKAKFIEAEVSVHGFAFRMKKRPNFEHALLRIDLSKPYSSITPIGKKVGIAGVLDGPNVQLIDSTGKVLDERQNANSNFPRRKWDDLDMAYFANYAFWNYFTFPKLLMNSEISWEQIAENKLRATFPERIPTHGKIQDFTFDPSTGELLQHDYTVDIIGKWAKAAHKIDEHTLFDGVNIPNKRIVTPRKRNGKARKRPILIHITVHDFKFVF